MIFETLNTCINLLNIYFYCADIFFLSPVILTRRTRRFILKYETYVLGDGS